MKKQIRSAIARATKDGKLRTNSVDSLTGANTGDNLGPGTPVIHFEQWEKDDIEVRLILKGGGCENKNIQYSLPAESKVWAKQAVTLTASANASCMRFIKRKAKAAALVLSALASAGTVQPATSLLSSSCSAMLTI